MSFVESFGYFMLVVLTVVGAYLLFKIFPFSCSIVAAFTLYEFTIENMALMLQDPSELLFFLIIAVYGIGFFTGLAFDMTRLNTRLADMREDFR